VVRAELDQRAARTLDARRERRLERNDLAERSRRDERGRFADERVVAQVEADHQRHARLVDAAADRVRILERQRERLLDEDVLAGGERGEHDLGVRLRRDEDADGRDVRIGQQLRVVSVQPRLRERRREGRARGDVAIRERDDLNAGEPRERRSVALARDLPATDQSECERAAQ
jgi:hypothetical protein